MSDKSSIFDVFKGKQYKRELEQAQRMLTPEMKDTIVLENKTNELKVQITKLENTVHQLAQRQAQIDTDIRGKKDQLVQLDAEILVQDFGLYKPMFTFATSEQYKDRLEVIRNKQKVMIASGTAFSIGSLTHNGSASQGRKLSTTLAKLLLRAFNSESDDCIEKVKFSNIKAVEARLVKSFESINKTCQTVSVSIVPEYLSLKLDELHLAYEYAIKKEEEKVAARQQRELLREQAKLEQEIAAAREKLEKEEKHFIQALNALTIQLKTASEGDAQAIQEKIDEIKNRLGALDQNRQKLLYREQNTRAGYVYIISNIGAFGDGVYKIGVTRRLEPLDRIDELGDASVPFDFDVHALIFSDDAPALETALHKAFADKKVNLVNDRREFFRVTLDEIEAVVKANHDKTVEFTKMPEAEQYRISEKIRVTKTA